MTRLEAGAIRPRQEWQPLEEVLGSALHQLDQALAGREVTTDLPETLPPLRIDSVLVGQVLVNILENAVKYSPPGSPLEVAVAPAGAGEVVVSVADRGPGIPAGHESRIFDKFHRARTERPGSVWASRLPGHRAGAAAASDREPRRAAPSQADPARGRQPPEPSTRGARAVSEHARGGSHDRGRAADAEVPAGGHHRKRVPMPRSRPAAGWPRRPLATPPSSSSTWACPTSTAWR
jgi:two-component system sensor histidine kinase KdpD